MADLTIGGTTFKVEVEGDATRPAVMLSSSLGTDHTMWAGQVPALTEHFRVIRYDARGHGGSARGDAPVSIGQLGRDALAILDALEIDKVHWLGLSMGGAIGLWLLAHAPERIDRAILANTAPKFGAPEAWNSRIASVLADGMADNAKATIERWFSADFARRSPERVAAIHGLLREASPESYAACCAALRDTDLRDTLPDIAHEVLIITGRDDPVVPADDGRAFIDAVPGARHVELAARHMTAIEAEDAFNAAVVGFLTSKRVRAKPSSKAPPAKSAPVKRSGAGRRVNAARAPLKARPAKRAVAKKAAVRRPAKKMAAAHRRPAAKKAAARRAAPKAATKRRPAKTVRKRALARRATPIAAARRPVKAAVKKGRPRKAAAKAPAKKLVRKLVAKAVAKKLPGARRKPVRKARRPTGRRKP